MKKIKADIRASRAEDGGVKFDCTWQRDSDPGSVWNSGPIDLPPCSGDHELEFKLDDRSGRNLKFYEDPDAAMWVNVDKCPVKGTGNNDKKQIRNKAVKSSWFTKRKLTLEDTNEVKCDLHYALRFDGDKWKDPAGKSYPPYVYDPEIKNGGRN